MNIIAAIDKYIELSIKRDILYDAIELSKREINHTDNEIATQQKNEKELKKIEQLLQSTYQLYIETVENTDRQSIEKISKKIDSKIYNTERKIEELNQKRMWAKSKGYDTFLKINSDEGLEYNNLLSECYIEIEKNKSLIHYYQSFANDLNYHASRIVK